MATASFLVKCLLVLKALVGSLIVIVLSPSVLSYSVTERASSILICFRFNIPRGGLAGGGGDAAAVLLIFRLLTFGRAADAAGGDVTSGASSISTSTVAGGLFNFAFGLGAVPLNSMMQYGHLFAF